MPTFIHDCHQPWLVKEIYIRMVATGFITFAESELLEILSGTSKCPYFLLKFFPTDLGQLLKLLDHPIPLRLKNQISASVQWDKICQLLLSSLDGRNLVRDFTTT
jgi:hypothetical protein